MSFFAALKTWLMSGAGDNEAEDIRIYIFAVAGTEEDLDVDMENAALEDFHQGEEI